MRGCVSHVRQMSCVSVRHWSRITGDQKSAKHHHRMRRTPPFAGPTGRMRHDICTGQAYKLHQNALQYRLREAHQTAAMVAPEILPDSHTVESRMKKEFGGHLMGCYFFPQRDCPALGVPDCTPFFCERIREPIRPLPEPADAYELIQDAILDAKECD